jgi:hypothetical protein
MILSHFNPGIYFFDVLNTFMLVSLLKFRCWNVQKAELKRLGTKLDVNEGTVVKWLLAKKIYPYEPNLRTPG